MTVSSPCAADCQAGMSLEDTACMFLDLYYQACDQCDQNHLKELFDSDSMMVFHGNKPVVGVLKIVESLVSMRPTHQLESIQVRGPRFADDTTKIYCTGSIQFGNSHALMFAQTFNIVERPMTTAEIANGGADEGQPQHHWIVRDSIFSFQQY